MSYSSFAFRMGAGFAGDVNRTHPATIEPVNTAASAPPLGYGLACVIDTATQGVRQMAAGDTGVTVIYGITVRPFPRQGLPQASMGAPESFNTGAPPANGVLDVLRAGYIMVPVNGTPVKGAQANCWVAATSGSHTQGGWEVGSTGGSTIAPVGAIFQGGADEHGICELMFNI